ncbi:MAG: hypothetical protein Q3979_02915 [Actinomycetaceae bacterium]|nr:hypothetical protein [Actinomycetaceae bacterium]
MRVSLAGRVLGDVEQCGPEAGTGRTEARHIDTEVDVGRSDTTVAQADSDSDIGRANSDIGQADDELDIADIFSEESRRAGFESEADPHGCAWQTCFLYDDRSLLAGDFLARGLDVEVNFPDGRPPAFADLLATIERSLARVCQFEVERIDITVFARTFAGGTREGGPSRLFAARRRAARMFGDVDRRARADRAGQDQASQSGAGSASQGRASRSAATPAHARSRLVSDVAPAASVTVTLASSDGSSLHEGSRKETIHSETLQATWDAEHLAQPCEAASPRLWAMVAGGSNAHITLARQALA